jgi:hypothetical protein
MNDESIKKFIILPSAFIIINDLEVNRVLQSG